jgi:indolepyruvate ferredoxin oxidoreductase beta subunit
MRLSDKTIASDLGPRGGADLILSMEPVESLRYAMWLSPKGALVSAAEPFINIPNYPELDGIINAIKTFPTFRVVEAAALAKEAGLARAVNMVMVGAASSFLPIKTETIEKTIEKMFASKDKSTVDANIKAFSLGRSAGK